MAEQMTVEQWDKNAADLLDKVENIVIKSQAEVVSEVLTITDKLNGIDKRMERMEHVVIGIEGDPNNQGIVNRCKDHERQLETFNNFVRVHERTTYGDAMEKAGEKKAKKRFFKQLESWQKFLIAIVPVGFAILAGVQVLTTQASVNAAVMQAEKTVTTIIEP